MSRDRKRFYTVDDDEKLGFDIPARKTIDSSR